MRPLIAAEILKLRTTRLLASSVSVVLLLAAVLPIFAGIIAGHDATAPLTPSSLAEMLRGPAQLTGAVVLLIGLLTAAGEYRHRTIIPARLEQPRASRLLAAKLVTLAAVGLIVGVAMELIAGAVGAIVLAHHHVSVEPLAHGVPRLAVILPVVIAAQGAFGVAIGALLRNTAAAVGVTLVWAFIIEGVLPVLTGRANLTSWLPGGALREITSSHTETGQLPPAAAGALLLAYAAALITASLILDRTREI